MNNRTTNNAKKEIGLDGKKCRDMSKKEEEFKMWKRWNVKRMKRKGDREE